MPGPETPEPADFEDRPWRTLRHPLLRRYLVSRFASSTALTLFRATVFWRVYQEQGEAWLLGCLGLLALPGLPCGLFAGVLADRRDRRALTLWFQALLLLVACALALGAPWNIFGLLVAVLAIQVLTSSELPARQALLVRTVPTADFPAAVVVHSTVQNLAWVTGPVLAGFLIDRYGTDACYGVMVALYLASLVSFATLPPAPAAPSAQGFRHALREGWRFVRGEPALLASMVLDMVAVLFASVGALLPIFAERLDVGSRGYGVLFAAIEVGTVIMSLLLLALPPIRRPGRTLLWAVAAFGAATLLFGLSRTFALSFLCLVIAGMADQVSMATRATILQLRTPDRLRGRVHSVGHVFIGLSNHLGTVESGFLAQGIGAVGATVVGAVVCLLTVAAVARLVPALRREILPGIGAAEDGLVGKGPS